MKTIVELNNIRKKTLSNMNLNNEHKPNVARVLVGMATCGIAAGARPVYDAFMKELKQWNLDEVVPVTQTGCIGMCRLEPMVDIQLPGEEKVTYVHMTPEMVSRIVLEHIVRGKPVYEYTLAAAEEATDKNRAV